VEVSGWRFRNRLVLQVKAVVDGAAAAVLPTFYGPKRPRCRVAKRSDKVVLSDVGHLKVDTCSAARRNSSVASPLPQGVP
jgi:hypothetical protein